MKSGPSGGATAIEGHTGERLLPGRRANPSRLHLALAAFLFTALAIYGSLVPLQYRPLPLAEALERFRNVPMLRLTIESRADWVANVLLFMPIGFLWLGVGSMDRPRWHSLALAVIVVPICAALSIALEFTQLWFPNRTVSQNDIIAETIGSALGAGCWMAVGLPAVDWLRSFAGDLRPKKQIDWLLQLYLLGFLIHALLPLDLTISVAELYHKFKDGRIVLIPFSHSYRSTFDVLYQLTIDGILFVPIGAWIATAFTSSNHRVRSIGACAVLGAALALAIELAQVLVYSRVADTTDMVTATIGAAAGGWIMRRWFLREISQRPVKRARLRSMGIAAAWLSIAFIYAVGLTALFWSPFEFVGDIHLARERWEGFFRTPFAALYYGSEFHATEEVLRKVLFFAPLGAIFASAAAQFADRRLRCALLALLFAASVALALGIEVGQLFQPAHLPDFTDVLLCAAGVALGLAIMSRILKAKTAQRPGGLGCTDVDVGIR